MRAIGLDVSTSVTGLSLLESSTSDDPTIVLLDHIEFKGCDTLWEKADVVRDKFDAVKVTYGLPDAVFIEESLMSFRPGFSSAATLSLLAKFNGLVSYLARGVFACDPTYIAATSARKICGIRVKKAALVGGKNAKEQVFDWCMVGPLRGHVWPTKRNGAPKDWSRDVTDSYVIARAGLVNS